MSGNTARLQAITNVEAYVPPAVSFDGGETPGEVFGENVFSKAVMQKRLPKSVYKSVMATIEHGAKLDPTVADAVASAMKDWAMEKGATHYAHVFYPLTGPDRREARQLPRARSATARRSPSSRARPSSRASPTRRASRAAGCATRSRPAATPAGT